MLPLFFIYALTDPDKGRRYIGQSGRGMLRPEEHAKPFFMKRDAHYYSTRWIKTLLNQGLTYGIEILEVTAETQEALDAAEIKWIAYGRAQGWRLTNHTDGGKGMRGYKRSAASRAKQSASSAGKKRNPLSAGHRAKLSVSAKLRKPISAENRAKQSASRLGKKRSPFSAEHCAKISAAHAGKTLSPEHRAKIGSSLTGKKRGPYSVEHRAKLSFAAKNRKKPSSLLPRKEE